MPSITVQLYIHLARSFGEKGVAEVALFKYRAFLSYSHHDTVWAEWLHQALERAKIDKELIGKKTPVGPVPKSLRPIFRDRDDFAAGHSLTEQTLAALASSQFMVVLCSPSAAQSTYVNEEIRRYKVLGGSSRIVPMIVDGVPGDPDRECFPRALRFRVSSEGTLTGECEEPVAADARPEGDGKELAKQKIIAGLLGLDLDEIIRREARSRKRGLRIRNSIIALLVALTVTSGAGFVWARYELSRNEVLLDRTLQRATGLVNQAVAMSKQFGVPRSVSVGVLDQAEGLFRDISELGRDTAQLRYRKATMLIAFARDYAALGNTEARLARATEAHQLMAALVGERPNDMIFQVALADTFDELGRAQAVKEKLNDALDSFQAALDIRQHIVDVGSNDPVRQDELSRDYEELGRTLTPLGRLADALANYRAGLEIVTRLAAAGNDDVTTQLLSARLNQDVGDVLRDEGKPDEVIDSYRAAISIYARLGVNIADDLEAQNALDWCNLRLGDIFRNQGHLEQAVESYKEAIASAARVANADPSNLYAQRDLAWGYSRVADVLRRQEKDAEALDNFRSSLAILKRLADADPNNLIKQREMGVQYYKIGDMLKIKLDITDALANYRMSLTIAQRMAAEDPNNGVWQCELARRFERIASAYKAQRNTAEAVKNYRSAVTIGVRITKLEPSNLSWQEQLAYFYHWLGDALRQEGNLVEADEYDKASLAIAGRLAALDQSRAYLPRDVTPKDRQEMSPLEAARADDPQGYNRAFPCGQMRGSN
jgi:eukaryotic-like serine/threonine-protein kinase